MKGSEIVIKALTDEQVQYIFGYTGGAIMPVFDDMARSQQIRFLMSRHEQGAAFMAQGLSRASRSTDRPQIGICISTSGPGAMNLVTGVADAGMDSVPMIAVTGQVATNVIATDAFQESDVVGVMMPITKQTYMPLAAKDIEETIHEAIYVSKTGRPGPVLIDIPKDVQLQEASLQEAFDPATYRPQLPGFHYYPYPDREKVKQAIQLINHSSRPLVLCGHGILAGNAGPLLRTFVEKTNIPVTFTLHGLSAMPVTHPLSLGMMGMHGRVEANRAIMEADLIIALGMRFDDRVTGKLEEYARNADVIHVEIDPSEIDKNVKTHTAINADVLETLKVLVEDPELMYKPRRRWFQQITAFRTETPDQNMAEIERGTGPNEQLLMKRVVHELSRLTDGQDIIVSDVGQHQMIAARFYDFQTLNSWFTSGGAGTMGAALPMSLGVKLARPDERVWTICGDGGFQMNVQELGAVMEHGIDVKIILLNNNFLGMVRQWQTLFFDGRYAGTPLANPDFCAIADAYRIPNRRVTLVADIVPALEEAMAHNGAYLLEFVCDPSEIILPMIPAGGGFGDMIVTHPAAGATDTNDSEEETP